MTVRELHIQKIKSTMEEIKTAKGLHKKDLIRHANRLKKELSEYDYYHRMLRQNDAFMIQRGD